MKSLLPVFLSCIFSCICLNKSLGQALEYYLPEKKLRVTVIYTVREYLMKGIPRDQPDVVNALAYRITIENDISVEEITVPDRSRKFELAIPQKLSGGGARFDWAFRLDKNGVLAGLNTLREPVAASILSGGIGIITNIISGVTAAGPLGSALPQTGSEYEEITRQEITVTELIDIPPRGIEKQRVAVPKFNAEIGKVPNLPSVFVSVINEDDNSRVRPPESQNRHNDLTFVEPKYDRLIVTVYHNGFLDEARVIDHFISVPQHGQLKSVPVATLMKGRKTLGISLNPDTGQLTSYQYKKDTNAKGNLIDINRQLEELSDAVNELGDARGKRLRNEIDQLELQIQRLELIKKKQELQSGSM